MKNVQNVKNESRVIRVDAQRHRQAKIVAAQLGIPLSALADEALQAELERRQATTTPDRQP